MKWPIPIGAFLLISLPLCCPAQNPAAAPGNYRATSTAARSNKAIFARTKQVNDFVRSVMQEQKIPGLSLAIVSGETVVYAAGYGQSNIAAAVPVTTATLFNIASISKPITAIAVMQLAEKKYLNLDAPVQTYVPSFPAKPWPITVRQLLCHQGGIRHYKGMESWSRVRYDNVLDALTIFQDDPLLHQPGTAAKYTSYGFNLLGAAVQGAASRPYTSYVEENIFKPAGMLNVGICDSEPTGTLEAVGYALRDRKPIVTPWFDATNKIPSGGFVCNSTDLALFAAGVMNHKLIPESTLNTMAKPQRLANGKPTHYGLGWLTSNWGTEKVIFHNGGQPGYSSLLYIVPGKKFAVAILTNMSDAKLTDLALGIRQEVVR